MKTRKAINPLTIKGNSPLAERILRLQLIKDCGGKCEVCGEVFKLDMHHRDGCGLNWARNNIQMLCHRCHMLVTNLQGNGHRSKELPLPIKDYYAGQPLGLDEIRRQYNNAHPRSHLT